MPRLIRLGLLFAVSILPSAASAQHAQTCPDLPASVPRDLVIRYEQHDYERPEALARFAIVATTRSCPADPMPGHLLRLYARERCVRLRPRDLAALYARLRALRLDAVRTRTLPDHPHHGGTAIVLSWGDRECRVADITHVSEVAPADREAYRASVDAVLAVLRRALE